MSQPLRIALFDRDEVWATHMAASLHACGLTVAVFCLIADLLASLARAEVDAVVVSWPHANDDLASLVEVLSRDCTVVTLVTDNDVRSTRLLFVSGVAEICHPLVPPARLAAAIERAVASSRPPRTRIWQPTA